MKHLTITPNWGEAFSYASRQGSFFFFLLLGLLLIAFGIFVLLKQGVLIERFKMAPILVYLVVLALVGGGVAAAIHLPAEVRFQNDKLITAEVEKYYLDKGAEGRKQYFDSLYNNCRLLGAPKNCQSVYKK